MSDPRINPNYRGEKCPTCGERLPMLFGNQCNHCNMLELKRAKERIAKLEDGLRQVADHNKGELLTREADDMRAIALKALEAK